MALYLYFHQFYYLNTDKRQTGEQMVNKKFISVMMGCVKKII